MHYLPMHFASFFAVHLGHLTLFSYSEESDSPRDLYSSADFSLPPCSHVKIKRT